MLGLAANGGIIVPVPCLERALVTVIVEHIFENLRIRFGAGFRGAPDFHQQTAHRLRRARHFGFEFVMGEVLVAEQFGAFGPQGQNFGRNRAVIRFTAICATGGPCLIGFAAQIAVRAGLQERHDDRAGQGNNGAVLILVFASGAQG